MNINELKILVSGKAIEKQLKILSDRFPGKMLFTTSFGTEDQVITQIIFDNNREFKLIILKFT